jgi:hypothetical protein
MAEWTRETPWRQGHVLAGETIDKLGLRDTRAPERTVVVITHDCDLAASPDKEPDIEVIIGRLVEKADGNFTHAKSPRVLHLAFTTPGGPRVVELAATNKARIAKTDLIDHAPRRGWELDPTGLSILQRWLAARYRRTAFPDAFEELLNRSGASARLTKILKPAGKHICAVLMCAAVTKFSGTIRMTATHLPLFCSTPVSQAPKTRKLLP